ncbi:MAG: hypothetical protein FVQ78_08585 [Solirubrobacterales bacterium]|nr:hypothetical protein [Solirubrobacterales bacterium]
MTTYSAQGTTVDRAYVMADPSMDKQEMYVAASRSRGETHLYATPEVQVHREEIAPRSPHLREGLPHIAEASVRDRAQLAAHEVALRSQFSGLPTEELVARRSDLSIAAHQEVSAEAQRDNPQERKLPGAGDAARRELAVVDRVLAERRELASTAARISPPTYVKNELGERPSDPTKRRAWDRGVASIERYRQEHGVKDPDKPFGREAKGSAARGSQEAARQRLRNVQRELGRERHASRGFGRDMSSGIGL